MAQQLKDGSATVDPRLDRLVEFDERSRNFPIRTAIPSKRPRSYTWRIASNYVLDQGREGACVGHAVAHELMARPAEVKFDTLATAIDFAHANIYWSAQRIDPWAGGSYPGADPFYEGTSVLAGMKVAKELGYFEEYRWSFNIDELILGVGHNGPAILGLWWFDTSYNPNSLGFIRPVGRKVGGHAILARAIKIEWKTLAKLKPWKMRTLSDIDRDKSFFTLRNSWGPWGYRKSGDAFVTVRDMETWLHDEGEAVFARKRTVNL